MGYVRHHAIIVSASRTPRGDAERVPIEEAHEKAVEIFGASRVSGAVSSEWEGWSSFLVPPDGSKEGWPESHDGDARRARFIAWLRSEAYEDGSSRFHWVEVQYADDEREDRVLASSGLDPHEDEPGFVAPKRSAP